jgi:hypothetical protein
MVVAWKGSSVATPIGEAGGTAAEARVRRDRQGWRQGWPIADLISI